MARAASRYTTGQRYDPTLATGRYPAAPVVPEGSIIDAVPQTPASPAPAAPAPAPAAEPPPVSVGADPVDRERPQGGEGGGVGSGIGAGGNGGALGDSSLGGMPGPSPDQSLDGMGRAALTGLGFAVSPVSTFAGILAGLAYDGMKGNPAGTTTGLRGILADQLGTPTSTAEQADQLSHEEQAAIIGAPTMNAGLIQTGDMGLGKPDAVDVGVDYGAFPGPDKGLEDGSKFGGGWGDLAGHGADNTGAAKGAEQPGFGGGVAEGSPGDGAQAEASSGANDGGSKWQSGGYTGAGDDGAVQPDEPAGTVHEGEVVLNAPAVDYYGPELLLMLNEMAIPRSRLATLVSGQ